jgi:hypothetical protein
MARTSIATDDFNRAGPGFGANWTTLTPGTTGPGKITASTVIEGSDTSPSAEVWSGAGTFTDDQYSSLEILDLSFGTSSYGQGVLCRASTDTDAGRDYYYFSVRSDLTATLGKVVNGTNTALNTASVSGIFTSTGVQRVELECEGTTIRAMRDGTALGGAWTVTDSALTTGKPGVFPQNNGAGVTGDNWEGGNITTTGGGNVLMGQVCT